MRPTLLLVLVLGACAEAPFASKPAPAPPSAAAVTPPSAAAAAPPPAATGTPTATSADQVDLKSPCVAGMVGGAVICAAAKGEECLVHEGHCYKKKPAAAANAASHVETPR